MPWQPKADQFKPPMFPDEVVSSMSLVQLGDLIAQQEKATKGLVPTQISLDQLQDKLLECCSDQRLSRFIQRRLCDPYTDRAEKERFLDRVVGSTLVAEGDGGADERASSRAASPDRRSLSRSESRVFSGCDIGP